MVKLSHVILVHVLLEILQRSTGLASNSGLLSSTLFTFQEYACEGEHLHIHCPGGTTVSIQFAQYGRHIPSHQLCPPRSLQGQGRINRGQSQVIEEDTNCLATTSLQVVLDECQDRQRCTVRASTTTFGPDPCRGTSKYLEVAYKCRPNDFHSRVTCEGEKMQLWCKKSTRIAVYSAMFGRGQHGTLECPASKGTQTECQSDYTLEEVMQRCHGRRKCRLPASEAIFGDPCRRGTPKYLNVVYTCVPKRILKDLERSKLSDISSTTAAIGLLNSNNDSPSAKTNNLRQPAPGTQPQKKKQRKKKKNKKRRKNRNKKKDRDKNKNNRKDVIDSLGGDEGHFPEQSTVDYKKILQPTTTTPVTGPLGNGTGELPSLVPCYNDTARVAESATIRRDMGFITDWISAWKFLKANKEKFILYFSLSMVLGLVLLLLIIIFRLVYLRRQDKSQGKLEVTEPLPSPLHTMRPVSRPASMVHHMRLDDRTFMSDVSEQTDDTLGVARQSSTRSSRSNPRNDFRGTTFRNDYGNGTSMEGTIENRNTLRNDFRTLRSDNNNAFRNDFRADSSRADSSRVDSSSAFRNDFRNDSLRRDPATMRSLNHYYG